MIGQRVSRYEIEDKIGQGGMGVVYRARDLTLPRHVAIKFLPPFMSMQDGARERFEREADATAALNHPNIADIYETGETEDGQLYIVMPFYEGRTLRQVMEEGRVDTELALDLFVQLARGVANAHSKGIVHRDLKPDNAFVTEDGFVKVLDFGLARFAGSTRVTHTGTTVGTVRYMSPEQARGDDVGPSSDVFSLGIILHQLMTGSAPFDAEHDQAVLYKIVSEEPPPLPADVPETIREVVSRSLQKDPNDRYASAGEMLSALGGDRVPQRRRASVRLNARMLAAVLVLVVAAAAWILWPRGSDVPPPGPPLSGTPLVVFPFEIRGTERIGYLEDGMVDLLSSGLNDVGDLHTIDPRGMYRAIADIGGDISDPAVSRRVASSLGASLFLVGSIVEAAGRFQASARLYGVDGSLVTESTARVDEEGRVFELAEEIARQVVVAMFDDAPDVPTLFDTTLPALKAYLEGESLLRSGHFAEAADRYQHAVAEDSTFAMAWAQLAFTTGYTDQLELSRTAVKKGLALGDALPSAQRDKLLVGRAFDDGRFKDAEELARAYIGRNPRDPDGWWYLADIYFHGAPLYGKSPAEGWPAMKRAVEYGFPDNDYGLLFHWRCAAAWAGEQEEYINTLRRLLEIDPDGDFAGIVRAELGAATDDDALFQQGLDELSTSADWLIQVVHWGFSVVARDMDAAREGALLWALPHRSAQVRTQGHIAAAYLDLARGRLDSASEQLVRAGELDPVYAAEFVGFAALLPLPDAESRLQRARELLLAVEPTVRPTEEINLWTDAHGDLHDLVVAAALSSVLIRLGDTDRASGILDRLESSGDSPAKANVARGLAASGRAALALSRGDTTAAVDLLVNRRVEDWWVRTHVSPFFSSVRERFTLARILAMRGDVDAAVRWYDTTAYQCAFDLAYLPWACYEAGKLLEKHGRGPEAAPYYERFIALWSSCDPSLQPMVDDARARLARL
jgi:tetratricopeptide (TPR) repeat protein